MDLAAHLGSLRFDWFCVRRDLYMYKILLDELKKNFDCSLLQYTDVIGKWILGNMLFLFICIQAVYVFVRMVVTRDRH